jgi:ferritin-like metal-binding protein YciE
MRRFRRRNRRGQKQGFQTHLHEAENHVKRLQQVSQLAELKAQDVGYPAFDGIINEASDVAGEVKYESVLDAALRGSAGGRALRDHALRHPDFVGEPTGQRDCVALLQQNLDQKKATDKS